MKSRTYTDEPFKFADLTKEKTMNIDDLTYGELKKIAAMFGGGENQKSAQTPHIGKKCVVRTYASGVHFGGREAR